MSARKPWPGVSKAFPFAIRQRVRQAETKPEGHVYYANYLVYAEVGRFAFLRHLGVHYHNLLADGLDFTLRHVIVRYRAALRFDDEFDVRVRVGEVRRVSWSSELAIDTVDGTHAADITSVQVLLERATFKPRPLPDDIRTMLEAGR